ncbi:hypothetical protein H112_06535 [Trichophyton rubrum D6]|nr:uncharacterized protein TERG_01894 [Trichophyton rubrum CBS 118892]EZF12731.1 hypothetical protein H100_06552 [Trichophyton rubrum MR850]EZF39178.1 hypothetical protein H102_06518 [Trichophyton rubrum CBS 100081]EZF50012.1 hypothetical protein H103_06544 [Trichophyton rubrum CBS 288.86]EZF60597.1 hypothetical protein H104_06526 [Trichophyton rubrum CBS 289.86]EZF71146.1 hypothetical protein H105_06555 [Trichophyton soudanense CBS 452.61]EZF81876.1 hypothetical protein H110_06539 [Trichophy
MGGNYGPAMSRKRKLDSEGEEDGDIGPARPDTPPKKPRVMGPVMPPSFRPESGKDEEEGSQDDEDDSDDDYGPSLPPPGSSSSAVQHETPTEPIPSKPASKPETVQRDDWMLKPPDQLGLSARMDPTKLKNRKFNTGNPARPAASKAGGPSNTWTETVEEKRKRLQNEVMGIQAPAAASTASEPDAGKALAAERAEKMSKHVREYNEKNRNKSLYSQHKASTEEQEKDDPSARAFDKEKDIRAPSKISHSQRREMLNKAADFNSRFSGGSFL